MSTIRVNILESSSGGAINIPSGNSIDLGDSGLSLSENSLPPSPSSGNGQYLYSDGSASPSFNLPGPKSIQTFTQSGTWNKPAGIGKILVRLVGGGGGGSGHGESAGAGGYSEKLIDVGNISQVSVTVGNGSQSGTYYSGNGGGGQTTSFGSYLSASGGLGANQSHQHCGGLPGLGSGGDLNLYGGGGTGHYGYTGVGGTSHFGGQGATGHPQGGNYSHNHQTHAAPGAGGGSGWRTSYQGAHGSNGIIVVYEYA